MLRQRFGSELTPWRPVRDIERAFDEMEQNFEDVFGRPFYPVAWRRSPSVRSWSPPMEVYEKNDEYIVKAELPGLNQGDIDISVVGDTLTIKGERRSLEDVNSENYYLCERCYGGFERSLTFPTELDAGKVDAIYENGVLEMRLPKAPEAKPNKVQIKSAREG